MARLLSLKELNMVSSYILILTIDVYAQLAQAT